jgi:hypothetical protein
VQAAVVNVIEPIFERDFAEQSYGFRPARGCKDALRRVDELLKAGYVHVVDADLKGYFDSIPHDRLLARLKTKIADGRVLSLIGACKSFCVTPSRNGFRYVDLGSRFSYRIAKWLSACFQWWIGIVHFLAASWIAM